MNIPFTQFKKYFDTVHRLIFYNSALSYITYVTAKIKGGHKVFPTFELVITKNCLIAIQEVPGSISGRVRNFNSYLGSGMGSTQLREDNSVAA